MVLRNVDNDFNATTIMAIRETEKMIKNEVQCKKYKDFDEFKREMLKL